MAPSPFSKQFFNHARSNSMPSKPHPLVLECSEHLSRLENSDTAGCSSSSAISHKLSCLEGLHDCIEKLFQSPLTQQIIARESQEKWVDELLDGSLRLLDACTAAKDAVLHTKECARELQSTTRRRRCGAMEFEAEAKKYLTSRKVVRKAICKALKSLNTRESKCSSSPDSKDHETLSLISLAREVEAVTLSVLESLLSFISGPIQSKGGSWTLVSKLIHSRRVACTQEADQNVFLKVDASLQCSLLETKSKSDNTYDVLCQLEQLESCIQDLEEGLEKMFKKLIKIRVCLLNIINH